MTNWDKAFVMIDVSKPKDKDYWKLIDWLKANDFEYTDANFDLDD